MPIKPIMGWVEEVRIVNELNAAEELIKSCYSDDILEFTRIIEEMLREIHDHRDRAVYALTAMQWLALNEHKNKKALLYLIIEYIKLAQEHDALYDSTAGC